MILKKSCAVVIIPQGTFYLGPSTKEYSEGYLELNPTSSLTIHNRPGSIENLEQIVGKCVMIVFDSEGGSNYVLNKGDELKIEPEGVWHIHSNPFLEKSLTYWKIEGDIRHVIKEIRKGLRKDKDSR